MNNEDCLDIILKEYIDKLVQYLAKSFDKNKRNEPVPITHCNYRNTTAFIRAHSSNSKTIGMCSLYFLPGIHNRKNPIPKLYAAYPFIHYLQKDRRLSICYGKPHYTDYDADGKFDPKRNPYKLKNYTIHSNADWLNLFDNEILNRLEVKKRWPIDKLQNKIDENVPYYGDYGFDRLVIENFNIFTFNKRYDEIKTTLKFIFQDFESLILGLEDKDIIIVSFQVVDSKDPKIVDNQRNNISIEPEEKEKEDITKLQLSQNENLSQDLQEPQELNELDNMEPNEQIKAIYFRADKETGEKGEEYVFQKEKERLTMEGRVDLAEKVQNASSENRGYDILSYNIDGSERCIEVKSTKGDIETPFWFTRNELKCSQLNKEKYYIYRVVIKKTPEIVYTINGSFDDNTNFEALTYRATLK